MNEEYQKAIIKLQNFTNESLLIIWEAIGHLDLTEEYAPGISMEDWGNLVYSEINQRNITPILI